MKKGTHTIKFENADDDGVIGEVDIEITKLEKLEFKIWCYSDKIDIDVVSGSVKEESTDKNKDETSKPEETTSATEETEPEPQEPSPVFYSTNDYETAKKGNTGVFSYKNKSGSYDIYWIINFDEGYVYWFTEGNGESSCDKVKIVSGDLNDKITVTWHDGGDEWSWYLHFKYVNHPETLIVNDHNGIATEFTTTDLDDALSIRSKKTIKNY